MDKTLGLSPLDEADMLHVRERRVCTERREVAIAGSVTQSQPLTPLSFACCTIEAAKLFLVIFDTKVTIAGEENNFPFTLPASWLRCCFPP